MTVRINNSDDELKRHALEITSRVLVRIRSLCMAEVTDFGQSSDRLKLIEKLADSSHNLSQLVASFGENTWAVEETLRSECRLCEEVLMLTPH